MQNLSKNEGINIENQGKKMLEETASYLYISSTIPETEDLIALNPGLIS